MPPEFSESEARESPGPERRRWSTSLAERLRGVFGWVRGKWLKAALCGGACLLAVGVGVGLWLFLAGPSEPQEVTLDMAMEALDSGVYDEARQMGQTLRAGGLPPEESLGAPSFVLGAAAAYEADDAWLPDKEPLYLLAARYLEEARDLGFPPGREGEGLYLLGRSLYLTGQMAASRLVLQEALKANPAQRTEIHRLLAATYLEDANPEFLQALKHNALHLADPTLSTAARHQGLLQRAEILLQLDKPSECLSTLAQIPPEASHHVEAIVTRGRVLMHEARALKNAAGATEEDQLKASQQYQAAIKTLRLAQGRDTLAAQASRKAMYLIGVCYLELGDHGAALNQFGRTRRTYVDTPEARAADFQVAELLRRSGRDDEALAAYRRALGAGSDPKHYRNPWLALDELRAGMLKAYEDYRDTKNFPTCLRLTRLLYPIFTRARTIELTAETCQLWGQSLLAQADHLPLSKAEPLRRQGRAQLRRAGSTYGQLAKLRSTTGHYPDDLWDSAQCYLQGQACQKAVEVLQEYMKNQSQRRHPQALLNLGEALLAVGRIDEALEAFQECIEFHPRDAAAFRARLAASRAHQEKGELEQAQALLEENLNGEFLTPDSGEWRESLFLLGQILHVTGRFEEAIAHLEEAVARCPDSPQTSEARYLIGDSYRRRAKRIQEKLAEGSVEAARLARSGQISEFSQAALNQYRQARDALNERQQAAELTRTEQSLLRNCYFSIGSTLFDLEQYDEAVKAYAAATIRYQNAPEALEAYVQIARAYHRLNKLEEARKAVEQAKALLDRTRTSGDFTLTTIYAADEWPNVLDSLSRL